MKIVSWNVNSVRARMDRVLEFLAEHEPDVLCLQETKTAPDQFPHLEFLAAGYQALDHSTGRWAGVALVVRDGCEISDLRSGLDGEPDPSEARWIEARIDGVVVASTYVINGRHPDNPVFADKLAFMRAINARASALAQVGPAVIVGDFNVCPTDLDCHNPAAFIGGTHLHPAERASLAELVGVGYVDAYRYLYPEDPGYTWWDYLAGSVARNRGLRIDLAFVSPAVAERVADCVVAMAYRRGDRPSDHAPLVLTLTDEGRQRSGTTVGL